MRASSILSLVFIGLASAALPKANEYKSNDCSGSLNYGHHNSNLKDVTMDDTTNSVYITGKFIGFSGKTGNGGKCTGRAVMTMKQGCNNLNNAYAGGRIKCVRHPGSDGSF